MMKRFIGNPSIILLLCFILFLGCSKPVHEFIVFDEAQFSSSQVFDVFPVGTQPLDLVQEFPALTLQLVDPLKISLPLSVHAVKMNEASLSKAEPGHNQT